MDFFSMMDITVSGLKAQRLRMETIASNLSNANTTRTPEGGPYRRRDVVIAATPVAAPFKEMFDGALRGVEVVDVISDQNPGKLKYEPAHPDADERGFVEYPNVDAVTEMVNLLSASRSYEANLTVFDATKGLLMKALEI